jgi:hypothetical protein
MSQFAVKNNTIFPCNDMGHLEFRDSDGKLISIFQSSAFVMNLHKIVGKDIDRNIHNDGFVSYHSKYKNKIYVIDGNNIYVDFSKL